MTDAQSITIRPLQGDDRPRWSRLLSAHGRTYDLTLSEARLDIVWSWLMDEAAPISGLAATTAAGDVVGIVHYQTMFRALAASMSCHLSDLHVAAEWRRMGIGRRLIDTVVETVAKSGCSNVRWLSHESNGGARRLYDRIACPTGFVLYEVALSPQEGPPEVVSSSDEGEATFCPATGPVIHRMPRPNVI